MSAANLLTTPERHTPHPVFIGPYRVLGSLGRGAMGAIRLGTLGSGTSKALVVLKEIRRDAVPNVNAYDRVLRQAQSNLRLRHENVVRTLGLVEDAGEQFLVLEFLHGQPFHQIVQTSRLEPKVPLRLRLQVIRDTLAGLHHAHELQDERGRPLHQVHGDVSPANVFVTYDGSVKVVNFGLTRAAQLTPKQSANWSKWRYAPPELLLGEPLDRRADVFSVGIMLWETICLRRFTSSSASDRTTVHRRINGAEPRIAQVTPQVPPRLALICDKALNVRREDRFATAQEFHEALVEYMEVSGASIKAAAVGHLLSRKFETDRTGVERRIKRYFEAAEDVRTSVELRRNTFEADDDEPTMLFTGTVASLPASAGAKPRLPLRSTGQPLVWLGVCVAILALGALLAMRQRNVPVDAAAGAGSPASEAAETLLRHAPMAADGEAGPQSTPIISPNLQAAATQDVVAAAREAEPAAGNPSRKTWRPRPGHAAVAPPQGASVAQVESSAPVSPDALPPAPPKSVTIAASGVGEDLRSLSPPVNANVDDQNPFH